MPHDEEEAPPRGRWERRSWSDPATVVAVVAGVVGLALILVDGLDEVWWGQQVTFGYWPYLLLGAVGFWFFGIRLWRIGGGPGGGE